MACFHSICGVISNNIAASAVTGKTEQGKKKIIELQYIFCTFTRDLKKSASAVHLNEWLTFMFRYPTSITSEQIRENLKRITEKTVQSIWHYLFLKTERLKTADGKSVTILHQGHWNKDAGPDFLNAKIRIGDKVHSGDVEIHRRTSDWNHHGHSQNAKYGNVILHAVYHHDLPDNNSLPPVLEMKNVLSDSMDRLTAKIETLERSRRNIFCYEEIPYLSSSFIDEWVQENGAVRFQSRIQAFGEVKDRFMLDWDELLYYGFMDALGFSKNREPFRRLAGLVPLNNLFEAIRGDNDSSALMRTQAILFGAAGLLNFELHAIQDNSLIPYLQRLEQLWNEYRQGYLIQPMKSADWQLFRLRPVNYPTLRIAGFSRWISRHRKANWTEMLMTQLHGSAEGEVLKNLEDIMMIPAFGYWNRHYIWNDRGREDSHELIGRQRAHEMAVNVIFPVLALYAERNNVTALQASLMKLYRQSPSREVNSVTRYMGAQLYRPGSLGRITVQFAQGLIHLYKRCVVYDCCDCRLFEKTVEEAMERAQDGSA